MSIFSKLSILSVDGGGIRGVVPLYLLSRLEEELRKRLANPHFHISDCFNVLSGTSTGAIITAGLSLPDETNKRPLYDANYILRAYLHAGQKIFRATAWESLKSMGGLKSSKYSPLALEKYLDYFFKDHNMQDLLQSNMIVSYDIVERKPFLFSGGGFFQASSFKINQALRASTSAPIYFHPARIEDLQGNHYTLIDGGVIANSSSLVLLNYLLSNQFVDRNTELTWLSLGTGYNPSAILPDELDGAFSWLYPLLDIINNGSANNVSDQTETLVHSLFPNSKFIRINPPLVNASNNLDDVSPENLSSLQHSAQVYIDQHADQWEMILTQLINAYSHPHA